MKRALGGGALFVLATPAAVMLLVGGMAASMPASACGSGGGQLGSSQVADAERQLGQPLPISREYATWGQPIHVTASHTPILSVNAGHTSWAEIAGGSQDAEIRRQAVEVKTLPAPVYLAFHHEPEGDPNGTPEQYVAAWRRYEAVFKAAGVTTVQWTFVATAAGLANGKAEPYYPGDDSIDVIGGDGYDWQGVRPGASSRSFAEVFGGLHTWAAAHGKPALVAELGKVAGPSRAAWITDSATTAKSWGLLAVAWWNAAPFTIGSDAVPALRAWAGGSASTAGTPGSGALSAVQVAQAAQAAGFTGDNLITSIAVSKAESGWDPKAINYNTNGSTDKGLWQINSIHTAILATGDPFDPSANARMAKAVFDGSGWPAWTTWTSGAYRQYLPEATAAVGQLGAAGPTAPAGACTPSAPTPGTGGGPIRQQAVAFALAQLGDPYAWGATGPDSYDCSGLVLASYRSAGATVPRTAGEQWQASTAVAPGQETVGDLYFSEISGNDAGHVMMVVSVSGETMTLVEAPHTGDVVKIVTLPEAGAVLGRVAV